MSEDSPASLSGAASLWDNGFSDYDMGSAAFCELSQRSHRIVTPVSVVADSPRTIGAQPNPSLYARLIWHAAGIGAGFPGGRTPPTNLFIQDGNFNRSWSLTMTNVRFTG